MRKYRGFGMVELMLSLFLASLILAGFIVQLQSARMQLNSTSSETLQSIELQYVVELMRASIREAGFTPCVSLNKLKLKDSRLGEINNRGLFSTSLSNNLSIQRMSPSFDWVLSIHQQKIIVATPAYRFSTKRPIIIADCQHAEIHELDSFERMTDIQRLTLKKPLAYHYRPPIYVGEWVSEHFSVLAKGGLQLAYGRVKAEEVSRLIKSMHITVHQNFRHPLVDVDFQLQNGRNKFFSTRTRTL